MNTQTGTSQALIAAARHLFAKHGYKGSSVRAIARLARANLGAISYHFGSKEALYEAVITSLTQPFRAQVQEVSREPGPPLERLERLVRKFFEYFGKHPELPRLIMHQLASDQPMPPAALRVLRANHGTLVELIEAGQHDGSIRPGNARLMALSIAAQPIFLSLMRPVLREAVAIDRDDSSSWKHVEDSVVSFVRAGLVTSPEV
ncbi:MAG: TetR/AcrR family transcriptional regulator, partial [Gemmatimonadales bacterium]